MITKNVNSEIFELTKIEIAHAIMNKYAMNIDQCSANN